MLYNLTSSSKVLEIGPHDICFNLFVEDKLKIILMAYTFIKYLQNIFSMYVLFVVFYRLLVVTVTSDRQCLNKSRNFEVEMLSIDN